MLVVCPMHNLVNGIHYAQGSNFKYFEIKFEESTSREYELPDVQE